MCSLLPMCPMCLRSYLPNSIPGRMIFPTFICDRFDSAIGKDADHLRSAYTSAFPDGIAHFPELVSCILRKIIFNDNFIRYPLVMKFGLIDSIRGVHTEVNDVN